MNFPMLGNAAPVTWKAKPQPAPSRPMHANAPSAMPVTASLAAGTANPAPKIRLQAPDSPPPTVARLQLPSPEQLGIAPVTQAAPVHPQATPTANAMLDWSQVQAQVQRLGGINFRLERSAQGDAFRASLLAPTGQENRFQQIEVVAANEAAAVQAALQQAEALRGVR